jgi:hypothetical protein
VVQVPGQPDEAVADKGHADEADQEHQRDGLSHGADQALAVARHRQGRPDERDRQRQRHPEGQLPPRDLVDFVRRPGRGFCGHRPLLLLQRSSITGQQLHARRSACVVSACGRSP